MANILIVCMKIESYISVFDCIWKVHFLISSRNVQNIWMDLQRSQFLFCVHFITLFLFMPPTFNENLFWFTFRCNTWNCFSDFLSPHSPLHPPRRPRSRRPSRTPTQFELGLLSIQRWGTAQCSRTPQLPLFESHRDGKRLIYFDLFSCYFVHVMTKNKISLPPDKWKILRVASGGVYTV